MRGLLTVLALLAPAAAPAQDWRMPQAEEAPFGDSLGGLLDNLLRQAQPELDQLGRDMEGLANRLAPALGDIATLVDDFRNYEAPQRLENGDILIRRKADAPPAPPIGDGLRDLTRPDPVLPDRAMPDPDAPEYEL